MDRAPDASDDAPAPRHSRPPGVPSTATWLVDRELWEELPAAGAGPAIQWRADGTVYLRGGWRDGRLDGPFTMFHPNGQVARRGCYLDGELDGPVDAFGSDEPTPESLRSCCVPQNAWQMQSRFQRGRLQSEVFYDRQGRQLLSDGSLRPERPAGIPDLAEFDEFSRRWTLGACDDGGCWTGAWKFWSESGALDEEAEYRDTRKLWSRLYDEQGAVRQEAHFEGDAIRHGAYRRRLIGDEEGPWADGRIREERGTFEHGQLVGPWTYLDGAAAVVRAADYGRAHGDDGDAAEALIDEDAPPARWTALVQWLRREGRVREALCAAARAAARGGDPGELSALLAEVTVPLTPAASDAILAGLSEGEVTMARALDALVAGADPAAVLRTLASIVRGASRAARDLVDAAILLAPERRMPFMTRALIRIELGEVEGALEDAARVAPESPDAAEFLRSYVRVLFPRFDFWPARETPQSLLEDMPEAPAQPLAAVRHAIQVYATRLALARAALVARVGPSTPWLPPDVGAGAGAGALLPDGPLELRDHTAEIQDQTEEGVETTEVQVQESLTIDPAVTVPVLMRLARTTWAALGWLCWSAGLREVALPETLAPPPDFGQAAGMIIARYWRAQDGVVTGGLRSMTAGVPGFVWEEMEIDALPRHLAEMVHDEYLEMRAAMLFLASPENLSPFQSDLRQT
jgi:hypothetical protein